MTITRLTLRVMSRMHGNIKSVAKVHVNKAAVNDRRIIKGWLTEMDSHKLLGEKIREGYNKACGEPDYSLDRWFNEFTEGYILNFKPNIPSIKNQILDHLGRVKDRNGFIIGKLMRACWNDVEVRIAEVPYKFIYPDYL